MMTSAPSSQLRPLRYSPIRVLIIPGLHNSGPGHWQTWLQTQYSDAVRVEQADWQQADLIAWSARIEETLSRSAPDTQWVAVAHSFGCLALAEHLRRQHGRRHSNQGGIQRALMVAPADPVKFQVADHLRSKGGLGIAAQVVGSENDPWMPAVRAQEWALHWEAGFLNLGAVGHINAESGFGPWPLARFKVDQMIRDLQHQRRTLRPPTEVRRFDICVSRTGIGLEPS